MVPKIPYRKRQGGAVAIIVGFSIFVLVGMLGLVLDLGRMFIIKTELQNGVDACALAAARELTGDANSLDRAEAAGILVGGRNRVDFQKESESGFVVEFSEHMASGYASKDSADPSEVKYVKCTLPRGGIVPWFMGVMGAGQQVVSAMAVASLEPSQTNCAIPIGLCSQGGAAPSYGYVVGTWYSGKFGSDPGESLTGSFNWVDFSPAEGGGASELKDILSGAGVCDLPSQGTQVGEQGQISGLTDAWNTRFGIYKGGGQYNQTTAPPDYTGYAYTDVTWPERRDAYFGASSTGAPNYQTAKASNLPYQSTNPVGLNGYPLPPGTNYTLGQDRRTAVVPIVDCSLLGGSSPQTVPVMAYACVLMLAPIKGPNDVVLEFRPIEDCATSGLAGGTAGPLVPTLIQ